MGALPAIVAAYKSNSNFGLNDLIIAFAIAVVLLVLFYFYKKRKKVKPMIPRSAFDEGH